MMKKLPAARGNEDKGIIKMGAMTADNMVSSPVCRKLLDAFTKMH
jgi:hypothetical protein